MLFTCVLIGLSSAPIFAASEDSPSSEVTSWLAPDLDSVHAKELAEQLSDRAVQVDYTTTDIYNLLYNAMRGEVYNSSYSLPKIASYTNRIAQILYGSGQAVPSTSLYSRVNTINTNISDLFHAVVDGSSSNIPVGPGIRQMLYGIDSGGDWETLFDTSQDSRDLLQLIYASSQQIHGDGQNNSYYLSNLDSKAAILNSSWTAFNVTYNGWSSSLNGTYDTSTNPANAYDVTYYFKFTNNSGANTYRFSRIFLNMINTGISDSSRVTIYAPVGNHMYEFPPESSYLMGRYVYLTDLPNNFASNQSFIIKIDFDYVSFTTTKTLTAEYLPDSIYSLLSNAELDLRLINRHFDSIGSDVSTLAKYLADPDKVAAEEASQQVIDDTLDGFTGNGSAAAKTSDTGSMKNMSGSIQSGLSTGASAGNAASVFSNQTFWSWFTQQNSDQINNPYPAPVVNMNNRKSSGDEIVDFMSGHDQELSDLLGGSEW